MGVSILELLSCLLFVICAIHFWKKKFSRGSRYGGAAAAEGEEATPLEARDCGAAGDQEVPEIHGVAYPLCTICPSGGCSVYLSSP
jgi:hypothetical protein